jgi:hypothetical protein
LKIIDPHWLIFFGGQNIWRENLGVGFGGLDFPLGPMGCEEILL